MLDIGANNQSIPTIDTKEKADFLVIWFSNVLCASVSLQPNQLSLMWAVWVHQYLLLPSSFSIRVGCGLNTSSISLAPPSITESPPPFSAALSMSKPLSSLVLVRLMLGPASCRKRFKHITYTELTLETTQESNQQWSCQRKPSCSVSKDVSKPLLRRKQGQKLKVGKEIPEFHSGWWKKSVYWWNPVTD